MWYDYIDSENEIFLKRLYNPVPALKNIHLLKFWVSGNEDSMRLIFEMPYYADNPPEKWINKKYNTTIIELDVYCIKSLSINASDRRHYGELDIQKNENDLLNLCMKGEININVIAEGIFIQRIDGLITIKSEET